MKRTMAVFVGILLLLMLFFPTGAFAMTAQIRSESASVECGDTLSVEFSFRENGIGAVFATFTYDDSLLEYVGGEGTSAEDGNGVVAVYASSASAAKISGTAEFRAIETGTAKLTLSVREALSFEEQPLAPAEAELELRVAMPAEKYVMVEADGAEKYALCEPPYAPKGFEPCAVEIAGRSVNGVTDGTNEFVYLTDPNGAEGGYYLRRDGEYLRMAEQTAEYTLLPMTSIPAGCKPKELLIDGRQYSGCTDGAQDMVYATCAGGAPQFYRFEEETQTIARPYDRPLVETQYVEAVQEHSFLPIYLLGGALILLMLITLITAIVKAKRA